MFSINLNIKNNFIFKSRIFDVDYFVNKKPFKNLSISIGISLMLVILLLITSNKSIIFVFSLISKSTFSIDKSNFSVFAVKYF